MVPSTGKEPLQVAVKKQNSGSSKASRQMQHGNNPNMTTAAGSTARFMKIIAMVHITVHISIAVLQVGCRRFAV